MIVCVCHGVPCSKIRLVVREGAETIDAVGAACRAGTDCGSCREMIEEIIEETAPLASRARARQSLRMAG